jgi:hypothetical protein
MKRIAVLVAMMLVASAALASRCPLDMKAIDAALPKAKLSAQQAAEVKKLRAQGESLHKAGKHAESEATLAKAKGILGIK